MRSALAGRDDVLLEPILRLLLKHVADPRFGEMVCDMAGVVVGKCLISVVSHLYALMLYSLDMYTPILGQSPLIDSLFLRLQRKIAAEIQFQKELIKAKGALDMLFTSTALSVA